MNVRYHTLIQSEFAEINKNVTSRTIIVRRITNKRTNPKIMKNNTEARRTQYMYNKKNISCLCVLCNVLQRDALLLSLPKSYWSYVDSHHKHTTSTREQCSHSHIQWQCSIYSSSVVCGQSDRATLC